MDFPVVSLLTHLTDDGFEEPHFLPWKLPWGHWRSIFPGALVLDRVKQCGQYTYNIYIIHIYIYIYIHIYIYISIYIIYTLYIIHMAYSNAFSLSHRYISVRPPGSGGRLRFAHGETGRHGLLRRALSGALPEAALPAWRGARGGGA